MLKVDKLPNGGAVAMEEYSGSWHNENVDNIDLPVKIEEHMENLTEDKDNREDFAGADMAIENILSEMTENYYETVDWNDTNMSWVFSELQPVTPTNLPQEEETVVTLPQPPIQKHCIDNRQGHLGFFCVCRQRPFKSRANLLGHINYHRLKLNPKFICQHCARSFPRLCGLKRHLLLVHKYKAESFPKGSVSCAKCGGLFQNRKLYKAHHINHSKTNRLSECDSVPSFTLENLNGTPSEQQQQHCADNTKIKHGWFCICKMRFSSPTELKNHIRYFSSSLARNYKCESCECRYSRFENLKNHMVTTHNIKLPPGSTVCSICYTLFTDRRSLHIHRVNLHSNTNRPAQKRQMNATTPHGICKEEGLSTCRVRCICNKTFCNKYVLQKHINHVSSQITFTCSYCRRKFWYHCSLQKHIKTFHEREYVKGFACSKCGIILSTYGKLMIHKTQENSQCKRNSSK